MDVVRISFLCAVLAIFGSALVSQEAGAQTPRASPEDVLPVTFDQAVAKAAANQPLILQAQAAVQAARAKVGQARSGYLPRMSIEAGYDWNKPIEYLGLGSDDYLQITPENAYDFHAEAEILVYDFGKRELQVKLARNGVDSALIGVEEIRQDVSFRTARIYYSVIYLEQEIKEFDEQLGRIGKHVEAAKKREAAGVSTRLDVLSTQVRATEIENKRIDASDALAKQKLALRQLIGVPLDQAFDVVGDFASGQETGDSKTFIALALANRPEIMAALKAESAAELDRSLKGLGNYPSLSAHGQAGYKNGILTDSSQDASTLKFNWGAGVLLTIPIFDGFRMEREVDEAAGKAEETHQGSEECRRTITTQVLVAIEGLSSSRAAIAASQTRIDQAQECLDLSKAQYEAGAGSNADCLDALNDLHLAKLGNLDARLRETLSGLEMRRALGDRIWSPGQGQGR